MRKTLIPFFLLFSFFTFADDFTDGLVFIRKKQYIEGTKLIERAFQNEKSKERKAKISRVLALSNHQLLTNSPEYYTKYALKFSTNLNLQEKLELHRKLGDFYLKSGQFKNAKTQFTAVLDRSKETAPLYEYALYNLGWVEVNLGKYQRALNVWRKYILSKNTTKLLSESIVTDFGKIWYEYFIKRKKEFSLKGINGEDLTFIEKGVRSSIKKESVSFTNKSRILLPSHPRLKNIIADELIKLHPTFIKKHCEVFKFIHRKSLSGLDPQYLNSKAAICLTKSKLNKAVVRFYKNQKSSDYTSGIGGLISIQKKKYTAGCNSIQRYIEAYRKKEGLNQDILTSFLRSCAGKEAFLLFLKSSEKDRNFQSLSLTHLRQLFIDKDISRLKRHLDALNSNIQPHVSYLANIWLKNPTGPIKWNSNFCNYYNPDDLHTVALYHISIENLHIFGNNDCIDASTRRNNLLAESLAITVINSENNVFKQKADYWANSLHQFVYGETERYDKKLKTILKGTNLSKQLTLIDDLSKRRKKYKKFRKTKTPNLFKELQWFSKKAKKTKWKSATLALRAKGFLDQFITDYQLRIKTFHLEQEAFIKLKNASNSLRLQL